jgi:hypothetical protein
VATLTVWPDLSPRLIFVDTPDTTMAVQEFHALLKEWEDDQWNMGYSHLCETVGGEDLGGGVAVGYTLKLRNAVVGFAPRTTPLNTGTATSNDGGIYLIDTGADFVTDGIQAGDVVYNLDDGTSFATVLWVVNSTKLRTMPLTNGDNNDWEIGDNYRLMRFTQCELAGGNVVSVDENGDTMSAVLPTAYTQIIATRASSATQVNQEDLEYASFGGGVTVDPIGGDDDDRGNQEHPVQTIQRGVEVAQERGFDKLYINGNITITTGDNIEDYTIIGQNQVRTTITLEPGALTNGAEFMEAQIVGTLDGDTLLRECTLGNLIYVEGRIERCMLTGTITLGGTQDTHMWECYSGIAGTGTPTIDLGGSGRNFSLRAYTGGILIKNLTAAQNVSLDFISGHAKIDATISAGTIVVREASQITDNSTGTAQVLIYDSAALTTSINQIISNTADIPKQVWEEDLTSHSPQQSAANMLKRILGLSGEYLKIDNISRDGDGNLTSATLKLYSNLSDWTNETNEIAEYAVTATFVSGLLSKFGERIA